MHANTQPSLTNVNLRALKKFAAEKLPEESPLRDVLMLEENEISASEFLSKTKTWLVLLRSTKRD